MPKRGLSLKKPLPEIRKILANDINMNIQNFGIVSNPQQRGIHLYGVLPVRLSSHVHTAEDLTVNATSRLNAIKIFTNLTNPWQNYVAILLELVTMLKLDRGTRRMQS